MTFEGRFFLDFAVEVHGTGWPRGGCTLAAHRSAISRAYYAVFWAAREALARRGRSVSDGPGAHQEVIEAFEVLGANDDVCMEIADALISLRRDRNKADYDVIPGLVSEIPMVLALAKATLESLRAIR